ncbi:MAG: MATE family efflux transporter [Peptococcaceae bacterium]|jgi:putative MATE family efflux protein|nr:MATE family efflux transporter [Peptococcaceae bacterium]
MVKFQDDLSEGSVTKRLILFALPVLGSNFIQSLYTFAGMFIVGNFAGPEAMSGVSIGGQFTNTLTQMIIGLCMGTSIVIGQYVGSKNQEGLKKVTATIITLLFGLSIVITVLMLVFKAQVLALIRTPAESYAESDRYLTVTMLGTIFIFGYNAFSAILRGMGDSKRPLYFALIACIFSIVLDVLFIIVLKLAAFGSALAVVLSQAVSMILCIVYLVRNKFIFDFKPSSFKIDPAQLKMILRFGLPPCIQNSVTSVSFMIITAMVNDVGGMTGSAAVGAIGRFNGFGFMPVQALSMSISVLCAQNFGAGRLDRAVHTCKIGTGIAMCFSYAFFALVQLNSASIVALFNKDPLVIAAGVLYVRSFTFEYLFIPFMFCVNGMFLGGGHTTFTLINSLLSSIFIRVPASYIFGVYMGWGLLGIGMGAPVSSVFIIIMMLGFLISGRWKHNVVQRT